MSRARKIEIRVHPLLDQLRPRLKQSARKSLEKSLIRVGQLSEVLVTADGYILDGRERYELVKSFGLLPRVKWLMMHSGIGDMPPGYDREDELAQCLEVIEETGRGKWRDSEARREKPPELVTQAADPELVTQAADPELVTQAADPELVNRLPKAELLDVAPLAGNPVGVRFQRVLLEHLQLQALKLGAARGRGRGKAMVASRSDYIRWLCWQDYINHLHDP